MRISWTGSIAVMVAAIMLVLGASATAAPTAVAAAATEITPHVPLSHSDWKLVGQQQPLDFASMASSSSTDSGASPSSPRLASLSFVLRHRNRAELTALFEAVSDPHSEHYGQHWTQERIKQLVAPLPEVVEQWSVWAEAQVAAANAAAAAGGAGSSAPSASAFASYRWNSALDILHLSLPLAAMESLIGNRIAMYRHARTGQTAMRCSRDSKQVLERLAAAAAAQEQGSTAALGIAFPPSPLLSTVDYLSGVTHFPLDMLSAHSNPLRARSQRSGFAKLGLPVYRPAAAEDDLIAAAPAASKVASSSPGLSASLPTPDTHGLSEILTHTWLLTDDSEFTILMFVACETPVTGGANWTMPSAWSWMCRSTTGPTQMLSYVSTTIVLTPVDGSSAPRTRTFPAGQYPLVAFPSSGEPALQFTLPLPSNFNGFTLRISYNWGGQTTSFAYGSPFPIKGSPRIHPLTASQLYGVPDRLLDAVTDSNRAASRMSLAALAISAENQGFFAPDDIAAFLDANRIDPWAAYSGALSFEWGGRPNNPSLPDMETTLDISSMMGSVAGVGLSVLHVDGSTDTPFEDLLNMALADTPRINVLSVSYGTNEVNVDDGSLSYIDSLLQQLALAGVSVFVSAGDTGSYMHSSGCAKFAPSWPASSPYVTSVGGSTLSDIPSGSACGAMLPAADGSFLFYDFASLMGRDFRGSDGGTSSVEYFLRVCDTLNSTAGAATSACVASDPTVSACALDSSTAPAAPAITGLWPSTANLALQWSYIDTNSPDLGVQYILQGAASCTKANPAVNASWVTTVQLVCSATQASTFTVSAPPNSCSLTYVLQTPLACSSASAQGGARPRSSDCLAEVLCSVEYGSSITSGGGFSSLSSQPRPSWQQDAVQQWMESPSCAKPETMGYNANNRGYPDVTLLAHNYEIHFSGDFITVDGTSASSPIMAGLIAGYNLVRKHMGLPSFGFINPLLYSLAKASNNTAFNAITLGSTRCLTLGEGCCSEGFHACAPSGSAARWNPASGLGSPNFKVLGPLLLFPDAAVVPSVNVSNFFFDVGTCAGEFSSWPPSPAWPDHSAPRDHSALGLVIGLTFVAIALVGLGIFLGVRWHHRRKYGVSVQQQPQPAHPGVVAIHMQPIGMVGGVAGPPVAHNWGPGRVLGHAENIVVVQPEGPLSPNDLSAPLAGSGPRSE